MPPTDPPAPLPLAGAAAPWPGATILFRHYPDGSVAATSHGMVGVGRDEAEALADLDQLLLDRQLRRTRHHIAPPDQSPDAGE